MNGNTCYRAHMIQGKYLFSRDLAYEPLSIEDAEEEMKAKKKKGSHVRTPPPQRTLPPLAVQPVRLHVWCQRLLPPVFHDEASAQGGACGG